MLKKCLITICLLVLMACTTSPTGRSQLILVSDGQMAQMGIASFQQMKDKNPPLADANVNAYVACISRPLLLAAGENPDAWEVQVFKDDSANAFALPGKKIGVHTGMLKVAENQHQLAAVIGHEIGHVQAKHGAERVSLNMAAQISQQAAQITLENNENAGLIMAAIGMGTQVGVLLPYSRTHESEADYMGLRLMAKAGFDPEQSVNLWQNMGKNGGRKPPEFLSTHPADKTRIKQLEAAMSEAQQLYQQATAQGKSPDCHL